MVQLSQKSDSERQKSSQKYSYFVIISLKLFSKIFEFDFEHPRTLARSRLQQVFVYLLLQKGIGKTRYSGLAIDKYFWT